MRPSRTNVRLSSLVSNCNEAVKGAVVPNSLGHAKVGSAKGQSSRKVGDCLGPHSTVLPPKACLVNSVTRVAS